MSYTALYRAWRPNTFSEISDQDAVVRTLKRQVETGHIAHAYLFCGTRGTGKTSAAKILSRAINCLTPVNGDPCGECEVCRALKAENCLDVMEIDAASNNGVDEIRDLRERINYPPTLTRYKVYIIDEVHMLSTGAFNALLKTLEEPPKHAVFILATTEPQKLPATILSRCQRFDFHRISVPSIINRLKVVLQGIGRDAEEAALDEIAHAAEGALRDALSLLDVCLSFTEGTVTTQLTRDVLGTAGREFMFDFTDALLSYNAGESLNLINTALRRGSDPRVFARDTAAHLHGILLSGIAGNDAASILEVTPEDAARFAAQARASTEATLMRAMDLFMKAENEMKFSSMPSTVLELAAVRVCHPEKEADASMEERMNRIEKMLADGVVPARSAANVPAPEPDIKVIPVPEEESESAAAPAEPAPQQWLDALNRIRDTIPGTYNMLQKFDYGGVEGNGIVLLGAQNTQMLKLSIERHTKEIDSLLQEVYHQEMHLLIRPREKAKAPLSRSAKTVIEQSYDVFGRDKVTLTD